MIKRRMSYLITEVLKMEDNMQNKAGGILIILIGIVASIFMFSFTLSHNFVERGNFVLSLLIGFSCLIYFAVPGLVVMNLKK